MDIDGDFDIVFGDGTPASLADALAEPPGDSWRPEHSPWEAVRASWDAMWQQEPLPAGGALVDDGAGAGGPSQSAGEERT